MKSVVLILVSITMLIKPLWPVADYIANYKYIVNVLCENKDQPELQCYGKCYLTKQLAKEAENSEDAPMNPVKKTEIPVVLICESKTGYSCQFTTVKTTDNNFHLPEALYSRLLVFDVSPPPRIG